MAMSTPWIQLSTTVAPSVSCRWQLTSGTFSLVSSTYHHGDLRRAVLDRAVVVIAAEGPSHLSLRSLAADLGVSHTAPRHHFGSREGVLSAVAAEGFTLLAADLRAVREAGGGFADVGVGYVR